MRDERTHSEETESAVRRAARMNILAGKHFNAGLRGIFFSIGYLGWFVSPAGACAVDDRCCSCVLVRRQFFSAARDALARCRLPHGPGKTESIRPDSQ